jgi:hypothetical protein
MRSAQKFVHWGEVTELDCPLCMSGDRKPGWEVGACLVTFRNRFSKFKHRVVVLHSGENKSRLLKTTDIVCVCFFGEVLIVQSCGELDCGV